MNAYPVCTIDEYGVKAWRLNGKLHREDGPAIEYANGIKLWYINDKLHRVDGPAAEAEYTNGVNGAFGWYLNNVKYDSIDEFCDAANITGAERTLFLLKWDY